MKRLLLCFTVLLSGLNACENNNEEIKYEGETVLTSEKTLSGNQYIVYGFSFSQGENIPYTITGGTLPDIVVSNEEKMINDTVLVVSGATLNSPKNMEAFYLNGAFNNADKAREYFDHYREVVETSFQPLAQDVQLHQVWTMQTYDNKYAKFLILDIAIKTDSPIDDYVEVTIEYKYQPDGSNVFDNDLRN